MWLLYRAALAVSQTNDAILCESLFSLKQTCCSEYKALHPLDSVGAGVA